MENNNTFFKASKTYSVLCWYTA